MRHGKEERHRLGDSNCEDLVGVSPKFAVDENWRNIQQLQQHRSGNAGKERAAVTVGIGTVIVSTAESLLYSRSPSLPLFLLLVFSPLARSLASRRNWNAPEQSATCVKDRATVAVRGATCCKNDNEVITEEIAYAIVADFPLFRRLPAIRGKRARDAAVKLRGGNCGSGRIGGESIGESRVGET